MPALLEVVNRSIIYTDIYFTMQYAILPMSLGHEPHCSLGRMGQKLARCKFVTIFCDQYQIEIWGICNNFNQFTHLSPTSGPSNDVIKMSVITNNALIFKKYQIIGKINVFNRFNASTAQHCKQK